MDRKTAHYPAEPVSRFSFRLCIMISAAFCLASAQSRFPDIFTIQGRGPVSTLSGKTVTCRRNIVTGLAKNGFFMQCPAFRTDNDPATSDGIFVYTKKLPEVQKGDIVTVTGRVKEFHGLTELHLTSRIKKAGAAQALPHHAPVADFDPSGLEQYEGMRVIIEHCTVCGPSDRYGKALLTLNTSPGHTISIDPEGLIHTNQHDRLFFSGTQVDSVKGILTFSFGKYTVLPEILYGIEPFDPACARPARMNECTIATYNCMRLFDTNDDFGVNDDVLTGPQYNTLIKKQARYIACSLGSPRIIAVQEVENIGVLKDLAAAVRGIDPSAGYSAVLVPGNDPGGMNIGFLTAGGIHVDSVYQYGMDMDFIWNGHRQVLFDRPPLVLICTHRLDRSKPMAVVGVHLRSRMGLQSPDSSRVHAKRTAQARALIRHIAHIENGLHPGAIIVAGDFNTFPSSEQNRQKTWRPGPVYPLYNPASRLDPSERYSYIYNGEKTCFDHILVSSNLKHRISGIMFGRGNCGAPGTMRFSRPRFRASDHDGLVVYIDMDRKRGL